MKSKRKKYRRQSSYEYLEEIPVYNYNSSFKLDIKSSLIPHSGLGVFNSETYIIPTTTYLGNYTGQLKSNNVIVTSTYCISLFSDNYIDAFQYPRSIFAMINDCRFSNFEYNCDFRTFEYVVEVWTTKNIQPNDELFVDYGNNFWQFR